MLQIITMEVKGSQICKYPFRVFKRTKDISVNVSKDREVCEAPSQPVLAPTIWSQYYRLSNRTTHAHTIFLINLIFISGLNSARPWIIDKFYSPALSSIQDAWWYGGIYIFSSSCAPQSNISHAPRVNTDIFLVKFKNIFSEFKWQCLRQWRVAGSVYTLGGAREYFGWLGECARGRGGEWSLRANTSASSSHSASTQLFIREIYLFLNINSGTKYL